MWSPWVKELVQTFVERRRLFHELEQANITLESKVKNRTQELIDANARLEAQANTDPLTGAYNRRFLFKSLEEEVQRLHRGGDNFAVLMVDLDFFKKINDSHGHNAGDNVLCEFVNRAKACVRSIDRICRYGGEEFVVFLPGNNVEGAAILAERLRQSLMETPVTIDGGYISVTASIGVAAYRDGDDPETILKRADDALYCSKDQGRNQVVVSE